MLQEQQLSGVFLPPDYVLCSPPLAAAGTRSTYVSFAAATARLPAAAGLRRASVDMDFLCGTRDPGQPQVKITTPDFK